MCFVRLVEVFRQAALPRHAVAVAVAIARRRVALPRPQLAVHFLRQRWRGGGGEVEGRLLARCGGVLKGHYEERSRVAARRGPRGCARAHHAGALRGCTCQWWKKGSADLARAHVPNAVTFQSKVG